MSLFGGANQGLRAQVSNPGSGRLVLIVFGVVAVILVATWLLAPYLPSSPKTVKEKPEPPITSQANKAVLDGAEWTYKAVMPPTVAASNGVPPSPIPETTPAPPPPAVTPPQTYQPKAASPQISVQERRRMAEEEERRKKAQRREYEEEVKRWKPLTWGKESKQTEQGQLIKATAYSLSPGELIPCQTEPVLSNEAPGAFRAFVSSHVYDSKSHRHIIVPEGTEINLKVGGRAVIAGDTRLPIESMTLTRPDGDWLKLGKVSISDRAGTPGFTGEIDRHIWRIIGSIFVTSVLRGGSTAIVANSYDQGIQDRMGSAAVAETTREGQQLTKQFLRTDPTITVPSAYGCYLLLEEPLVLSRAYVVR